MVEVRFLRQVLGEEKNRNVVTFRWVQNRRSSDMEENLSFQNQLKEAMITIDSLKDKVKDYSDEILRLEARMTLAEAHMGLVETRFHYTKSRSYETNFKDYKILATQILPEVGAYLLQILIMAQAIRSLQASQANWE